MSVIGALRTSARGLGAAAAGISVTSQNVSNVNTPGYARRSVEQSTMDPVDRRGISYGQGVSVDRIHRASDALLGARYVQARGDSAYAGALESALKVPEGYFDESSSTGIVEAYDAFFDAMDALAASPTDHSLRQGVVVAAQGFAGIVSRTAEGLDDAIAGLDAQLEGGLGDVNRQLGEIAALNDAIAARRGEAPDLMDQRDQLVDEVAGTLGALAEYDASGQLTLYVGGHAVVSGGAARTLSVADDAAGVAQLYVSADSGRIAVTSEVGGELGGVIAAREKTQGYLDTLDAFATAFAGALNSQHAAGFDPSGAAGGAMFSVAAVDAAASLRVDASLAADPDLLALAGAASATAGDTDNLDALRALGEDSSIFAGGSGHDVLSTLVSTVGHDAASASSALESADASLSDLGTLYESIRGVDSDEEAIKLLEYQSAWRASAKVLAAADEMIQDLLGI